MPGAPDPHSNVGHWNPDGSWTPAGATSPPPGPAPQAPNTYGQTPIPATAYGSTAGGDPYYASNRAQWGGVYGGANKTASNLSAQGDAFIGRQPTNLWNEGVNVDRPMAENQATREQQLANVSALRDAANGNVPSAAMMQMGGAADTSLANAYAQAHGIGGGTGAYLAGNAASPQLSQLVAQGGAGVAGETGRAEDSLLGGMSAITHGDVAQQGLENQMGITQARLSQANNNENNKMNLAYNTMAEQTMEDQLAADTAAYRGERGYDTAVGVNNFNNQNQFLQNMEAGAMSGLGSTMTAAAKFYGNQDYGSGGGGNYGSGDISSDVRGKIVPSLHQALNYGRS